VTPVGQLLQELLVERYQLTSKPAQDGGTHARDEELQQIRRAMRATRRTESAPLRGRRGVAR